MLYSCIFYVTLAWGKIEVPHIVATCREHDKMGHSHMQIHSFLYTSLLSFLEFAYLYIGKPSTNIFIIFVCMEVTLYNKGITLVVIAINYCRNQGRSWHTTAPYLESLSVLEQFLSIDWGYLSHAERIQLGQIYLPDHHQT